MDIAEYILENRPRSLGWRDVNSKTPLHYAARNNKANAVRWILFKDEDLAGDRDYKVYAL